MIYYIYNIGGRCKATDLPLCVFCECALAGGHSLLFYLISMSFFISSISSSRDLHFLAITNTISRTLFVVIKIWEKIERPVRYVSLNVYLCVNVFVLFRMYSDQNRIKAISESLNVSEVLNMMLSAFLSEKPFPIFRKIFILRNRRIFTFGLSLLYQYYIFFKTSEKSLM